MNARFKKISAAIGIRFFLLILLSGCSVVNNKWIRIHRTNPEATLIKMKAPNVRGPKERVEKFFHAYGLKEWKDIEGALTRYSDLHFMKDRLEADFFKYSEITPQIFAEEPVFNKVQDRARVRVNFEIEKIQSNNGQMTKTRGSGTFVLMDQAGWDIISYVGDPFWDETK